jgi:hypothetical protein
MTENKRRMPSDAKSLHCLWHGELKGILKCEYLHVMYYYNGDVFLETNQSETRIVCGGHVC